MKKINFNSRGHWIAIVIAILVALEASAQAPAYSFRVSKTGEGNAILFIPGLACDGSVWESTIAELNAHYECHAVTLPGFAGQPPLDIEAGFTSRIRDELLRYVKEENLLHPVVVGHSLGGFIALDMLASEPDVFERAIIVDGLPFLAAVQNPAATEETMKTMASNMLSATQNIPDEQYAAQQKMTLRTMITDEENIEKALEWSMASNRATINQAMYDLYTTDLRDDMARVQVPVLVLGSYVAYQAYGATKETVLATFKAQYQSLDGVHIELSDIGKHFIMWDDPEFFLEQTQSFLSPSASQ